MPDTVHDSARDVQEEKKLANISVSHAYVKCSKVAVAATEKQVYETRLAVDSELESIKALTKNKRPKEDGEA